MQYNLSYFKFILVVLSSVLLSACFKEETPIKRGVGNTTINSVFLGENYENQIFFDFGTNTFQQKNLVEWDLRFQSGKNETGIFVNTGKEIKMRKLNLYNLDEPLSTDTNYIKNIPELVDDADGDIINSAIGDWTKYVLTNGNKSGIYVLELTYETGWNRFVRLQILSSNDSQYVCKFVPLYDKGIKVTEWDITTTIPKNNNQNFTYYSFKNNGKVIENAEPDKRTWDIEFTKYKHTFFEFTPPLPYPVTGILSNSYNVEIAIDSSNNFENINLTNVKDLSFSKKRNTIGFEYKAFSFKSTFEYTINSKNIYVIKDTNGNFYKLKFLDFYNNKKERGYPKFEFIILQ